MTARTVPTDWTESAERRAWQREQQEAERTKSKEESPFVRALLATLEDPEFWADATRQAEARNSESAKSDVN